MRRLIPRLVLFLALAWAVLHLGRAIDTYHRATADTFGHGEVARWRLGEGRPEALREFLAPVAQKVPPGRVVVFASGTGDETQDFFLTYWAGYFLPRHRVIPLRHPRARLDGEFLAAYNTDIDHPRLEVLESSASGVIYRVLPP